MNYTRPGRAVNFSLAFHNERTAKSNAAVNVDKHGDSFRLNFKARQLPLVGVRGFDFIRRQCIVVKI